jgi:hypothetical protein
MGTQANITAIDCGKRTEHRGVETGMVAYALVDQANGTFHLSPYLTSSIARRVGAGIANKVITISIQHVKNSDYGRYMCHLIYRERLRPYVEICAIWVVTSRYI